MFTLKSVSLSIGSKVSMALASIKDGVQMFLFDIGMDCLLTLTDTKQLYTDVFANLQKEVVPNLDQSQPLNISVRFY
jgi:GTP1/Obg family GTP-binding protein